jgi:hypothetical protein
MGLARDPSTPFRPPFRLHSAQDGFTQRLLIHFAMDQDQDQDREQESSRCAQATRRRHSLGLYFSGLFRLASSRCASN